MTAEEQRLLSEIQESGGKRDVPGKGHPGGAYSSLQTKNFLRVEHHNKQDDGEGGFTFDGMTFYITPDGKMALENGVFFPRMKELLEKLTPEQAEFLVTVAERMVDPIREHMK